jgi:hypothetical protein
LSLDRTKKFGGKIMKSVAACMKPQFLKDHLIDFEVVAAICIATLLWFEFDVYWLFAILSGLLAFVLISLLLLIAFYVETMIRMRRS